MEEEEAESWQKRKASVLFKNGNKNLLSALADTIANGIPCLARASLITISWMSSYLNLIEDTMLPPMAFSILRQQLLQSLNYDKDVEERVLASYSLLYLVKYSGIYENFYLLLSYTKLSFSPTLYLFHHGVFHENKCTLIDKF